MGERWKPHLGLLQVIICSKTLVELELGESLAGCTRAVSRTLASFGAGVFRLEGTLQPSRGFRHSFKNPG
jgi:hypothetical protein